MFFSFANIRLGIITIPYLLSILFLLSLFFPTIPFHGASSINLGLDLTGGSQVMFKVDFESCFGDRLYELVNSSKLKSSSDYFKYSILRKGDRILIKSKNGDFTQIMKALKRYDDEICIEQIDKNSLEVTYSSQTITLMRKKIVDDSIININNRIDQMGTKESLVHAQGDDKIVVQFPGIYDASKVKSMVGKTAKLSFYLVSSSSTNDSLNLFAAKDTLGNKFYLNKRDSIVGDHLSDAKVAFNQNGKPVIRFRFNSQGAKRFAELTRENKGSLLAIVLDGVVLTAPMIKEPILDGNGEISGQFSLESANDLAVMLRSGSLPATLEVVEEKVVGPSLGRDSILAAKKSAIVAFALVSMLMIYSYKLYGLISVFALSLNLCLMFSLICLFGITLTFPGIAAVVLTIGMSVDTNVLVFERIKEELAFGCDNKQAVITGFRNAMSTITDSNLTTIIACLIIFFIGSGPIKGFSINLLIGVLTSLYSSIALTRNVMLRFLV